MSGYSYTSYSSGYGSYYSVEPGAYGYTHHGLSYPGDSYSYYRNDGAFTTINSGDENYYGGKSYYAATLGPNGNFIENSYKLMSSKYSYSSLSDYISHTQPASGSYYYYSNNHGGVYIDNVSSISHSYTDGGVTTFNNETTSLISYFDGSYKASYFESVGETSGGMNVVSADHSYSLTTFTDPYGYTTYTSHQN